MKVYLKKIIRNIEDYGYWISIKKAFNYIIRPIYSKRSLIIYEINLKNCDEHLINSNYEFKLLNASDKKIIDIIEEKEEWLKGELRERISSSFCMAILHKKNVVGFYLASFQVGRIPLLKLKMCIENDEAWGEQITIFRDYRRMGLGSKLRSAVYSELKKMGIKHLYGHRAEYNIASQKSVKKYLLRELLKAEQIIIIGYNRLRLYNMGIVDINSGKIKKGKIVVKPNNKSPYIFKLDLKKIKVKEFIW
jgi:GNAT superfamily N-acetyltransferase